MGGLSKPLKEWTCGAQAARHPLVTAASLFQHEAALLCGPAEPITGRAAGPTMALGEAARHDRPGTDRPRLENKRSEENTSELQSLMRNAYAVICLKKKHKHT